TTTTTTAVDNRACWIAKRRGRKRRQRVVCPCSHDPQQFAPGGGEIDRVYGHG
ncbi:unnamed protein product, partial [Pylaiella littoralis]